MSKIVRAKMISFSLCFLFLLFLANLNDGGKNKKLKQKTMKSAQKLEKKKIFWERNGEFSMAKQWTEKANECLKNVDTLAEEEEEENGEKDECNKLMANFVLFFKKSASNDAAAKEIVPTLNVNSMLWFIRRKIINLLNFSKILFANDENLVGIIEEFVREWKKTFGKNWRENAQKKREICTQYKFGIYFIKLMVYYAKSCEALAEYLRKEISLEIFRVDEAIFLNCDINGQTEQMYNNLLEQIGHINGQNFMELLDIYENFREFFNGFENEKMRKTKEAMNKLVKSEYVTKIEDKFPNIFRIDIILNSSLFERLQSLLTNKSFSTAYRMEFSRLTMAFLIDRSFNSDLLLIGGGKGAHSSDRITANWREAMAEAIAAAYTDLGSEQNLCMLIKMNEFAQLISKKRNEKGSEKLPWDLRMDELCEDGTERAKIMDKFVGAELGEIYTAAIERVVAYRREHFIGILRIPGAKTRLKQLVESEQRMTELASKNGLGEALREITLGRSDILWTHYQFVLLSEKGVSTGDSKLGADLCVFLFWLRMEFDQLKIGSIWPKIAQYFETKIYDPIFDQNESEMKETEQILIRIFVETKHFVKNLEKKGSKKSKNYGNNFKKWKELIEGKEVKNDNIEEKEMEEHLRWMKERHKKEFWKLIRGRELTNFEKMFKMREEMEEQMSQKLGNFFDANTSNEIMTKFGGKKQKEKQIKKKEIEEENISGQNEIMGQNGDNLEEDEDNLSVVQCPQSNVPIEQLRAIDNDNQTAKNKGILRETIDAFLAYLSRDETNLGQKEKQRHVLEMKVYGMLWYEAVFLDNLMAFATDCAGDRSAGELFWMELEKLKKQWEELMDGSEPKCGRLLLLFEFGKHFVNNKILWENSERWQKRLISEKMVELEETKRTENWAKPKFDEEKAEEYCFTFLQLYGSKSDTNYMIFFVICDLIDVSLEVRRFFCDSSDSKAMQKVKIRVGQIMDEEYLIQLDEMFPEILQIDLLLPWTQTVLYKRLLATKSGTDQHLRIECRFALPVLFHRLKWLIVKTPTLKGKVLALFREKLRKVQRIAFRGLRRELVGIRQTELMREELLKSVCILQRFYEFASAISALPNGAKEMPTEEEIRNWNTGRNCMTEEGLIRAYQNAHLSLIQTHGRQLTIFFRTNVLSLKEYVREKRGAKTRIRKLVNGQEGFMDEFRMELRDRNLFSNWRLMDDYLDAFFDLSKATRVVGNLSVFISVWMRWMDHQFWMDNSLGQKPLEELQKNRLNWAEMRSFFEDLYDELVDAANFDELEQKSDLLRELQRRIWEDFVGETDRKRHPLMREKRTEKQRDGKSANEQKQQKGSTALSLGRKWSKYRIKWANLLGQWQRLVRDAQQKARGVQMMEEEGEYEQWIDGIHWDTLINLLSEDGGKFRESLKNGFVRDAMAKARLKDFINWEMVEKLMQLLAREDEEEFKKELELIRQRNGWRERETAESEEEVERKSREERAMADQKMHELIREEEHIKELKRKMEERQLEKRRKEKVRERALAQKREEGQKDKSERESPTKEESGRESKEGGEKTTGKETDENNLTNKKAKNKAQKKCQKISPPKENSLIIRDEGQSEENEKEKLNLIAKELNGTNLMEFISEDFLFSKYEEFISKPTKTKHELLGIGTLINVIWNRMKITEEMGQRKDQFGEEISQKIAEIGDKWLKISENPILKAEKIMENGQILEEIRQKMHLLLREATFVIEGMENCEENAKREEKSDKLKSEREKMTKHLNRNKLLKTIATKESANESWHKLSETERNEVLGLMFRKKANLTSRFNELLEDWTTKVKQQRIDKNSYEQFEKYANDDESEMSHFALKFIENSQQIYLNCHNVRRQEEECYEFLKENGQTDELSENGALIEQMKAIVEEWIFPFPSVGSARLLLSGSSLLGAATADSDIDLICIVPQRMALNEQKETFYGKDSTCDLAKPLEERFCEDKSLYCHFCKNVNVLSLFKIPFAQIPLLQLKFAGKDFDITFVAVPFIERLPDDPLDGADVKAFLEVIGRRGKAYEAMHKSLTSYLDNIRIKEIINEKNTTKFRQLLSTLKLWAKTNHIYGNMFGFLNGISLAIIAAKTIFWYPKSSVAFLFEKALLILLIWEWPVPIILTDRNESTLTLKQISELKQLMPIITPNNSAQNATFFVNDSTFKIIKSEIKKTLFQMKLLKNSNQNGRNSWQKLFPVQRFVEKFAHFVVICCVVSAQIHIDLFCGFVERRIRPFLLRFDLKMGDLVEFTHLMPEKNLAKGNECPQQMMGPQFVRAPFCKVWLVGVKLKIGNEMGNWEMEKHLNVQFSSEFDAKIYTEYDNTVLRGWYQNIKLTSKVIPNRTELSEWKLNIAK